MEKLHIAIALIGVVFGIEGILLGMLAINAITQINATLQAASEVNVLYSESFAKSMHATLFIAYIALAYSIAKVLIGSFCIASAFEEHTKKQK